MRGDNPRVEPPALDSYSDVPLYNTRAVVHQTGVPAPTLRAWERRYGILTPQRGGFLIACKFLSSAMAWLMVMPR